MKNFHKKFLPSTIIFILFFLSACDSGKEDEYDYDLIIRGGLIYDGSGNEPYINDIGIIGDTISLINRLDSAIAKKDIDANGLAVAPGFINMLSWATTSLIEDGRAMSDIKQGVTLEIMGEGSSMGPMNDSMKADALNKQGNIKYDIEWTTLNEYLEYIVKKGISPNVASYIGATTVRIHEIGYEDRKATDEEIQRMQNLVRQAMQDGALGVGSSLIYTPANFADTNELIALVSAAAEYDGKYISHIRSEGDRLEEAVQELIKISSITGAPAEIYHIKAAGKKNWHKLENILNMIEFARASGLRISANMYPYMAGATGLDATMPPWVQEGGHNAWVKNLKDIDIRKKVSKEIKDHETTWENFFSLTGSKNILLLGFKNPKLQHLTGKTLSEVSILRETDATETAMNLVVEDDSRVNAAFFLMSEDNIRKKIRRSWISFGSDASAIANEGVFLNSNQHPRAYGNFSKVFSRYVKENGDIPLSEAIRRMTSLPAFNTGIRGRGLLKKNYYADIVIFDPNAISDKATYEKPHQYSEGMKHVFINGIQVLEDGDHTGALPGRVVRGPGWTGWPNNSM